MQNKSTKIFHKIVEKIPLKNKVLMKAVIPEEPELMVTKFNQEDTMAACGYSDGHVRVFNLGTDNKISQINAGVRQQGPVNALRWRPVNQFNSSSTAVLLVANSNGHIYQFTAKTGKQIWHHYEEGNYIMAIDYNPNGTAFATAGKDNIVRIYDEETKKVAHELNAIKWHKQGHNNRIFSVKFKRDEPDLLVSGGWDQNVNIWDIRTESVVSSVFGPKIGGDSLDIRENYLLTGANRGKDQLQLYDCRQGKLLHTYTWDQYEQSTNGFIFCSQFCNYNKDIIMAVGGTVCKFYSLEEKNIIVEVEYDKDNILYTCDSGNTGTRFLVGGKNGSLFYFGNNKTLE